jgi:septal ring factor EnvC (AmiA/AmiB activator)
MESQNHYHQSACELLEEICYPALIAELDALKKKLEWLKVDIKTTNELLALAKESENEMYEQGCDLTNRMAKAERKRDALKTENDRLRRELAELTARSALEHGISESRYWKLERMKESGFFVD